MFTAPTLSLSNLFSSQDLYVLTGIAFVISLPAVYAMTGKYIHGTAQIFLHALIVALIFRTIELTKPIVLSDTVYT